MPTVRLAVQSPAWASKFQAQEYVLIFVATDLRNRTQKFEWTQQANYLHTPGATVTVTVDVPSNLIDPEFAYWHVALACNFVSPEAPNDMKRNAILGAAQFAMEDLQPDCEPDWSLPYQRPKATKCSIPGKLTRPLIPPLWEMYKEQFVASSGSVPVVDFYTVTLQCPLTNICQEEEEESDGEKVVSVGNVSLHRRKELESLFLIYTSMLMQHLEIVIRPDQTFPSSSSTSVLVQQLTPSFSIVPSVYYSPGPFLMPLTNVLEQHGEMAWGSHGLHESLLAGPIEVTDDQVANVLRMLRCFLRMRQWFFNVQDEELRQVSSNTLFDDENTITKVVSCALNALNGFAMGILYGSDLEITNNQSFPSDHTFENSGIDDCEGLSNRTIKIARLLVYMVDTYKDDSRYESTYDPVLTAWADIVVQYDFGLAICAVTKSNLNSNTKVFQGSQQIPTDVVEHVEMLSARLSEMADDPNASFTNTMMEYLQELGDIASEYMEIGGHGTTIALRRDDSPTTWPASMYIEGTAMAFNSKVELETDIDTLSVMELSNALHLNLASGFSMANSSNPEVKKQVVKTAQYFAKNLLRLRQSSSAAKECIPEVSEVSDNEEEISVDNEEEEEEEEEDEEEDEEEEKDTSYSDLLTSMQRIMWKKFVVAVRSICKISPREINNACGRFFEFHAKLGTLSASQTDKINRAVSQLLSDSIGYEHVSPILQPVQPVPRDGRQQKFGQMYAGVPGSTFDISNHKRFQWKLLPANSPTMHEELGNTLEPLLPFIPDPRTRGQVLEYYALFLPGAFQPSFCPTKQQQYHAAPLYHVSLSSDLKSKGWFDFAQTQIERIRSHLPSITVFADMPSNETDLRANDFMDLYESNEFPSPSSDRDVLPSPTSTKGRTMLHGKWYQLHRVNNQTLEAWGRMLTSIYQTVTLHVHIINPSTDVGEFVVVCHGKRKQFE